MSNMNLKSLLSGSGTGVTVLFVVATIVVLICTVMIYVQYCKTNDTTPNGQGWDWRGYLNFDKLSIAGVLKFCYIFCALETCVIGVCVWVAATVSSGVEGFFVGLLCALIIVALYELMIRVIFELMILQVKIAENTSALRAGMETRGAAAGRTAPLSGTSSATPQGVPAAREAQPAQQQGASSQAAGAQAWTCPSCGTQNTMGSFCRNCGSKRQ